MLDKQAFLQVHAADFPGYRLVTAADLKVGAELLRVRVRSVAGSITFEVQTAELKANFRSEGFLGKLGQQFVNMFLPHACPGGRYDPVHEDEVLAATIKDASPLTGCDFRGLIFLIHDHKGGIA